jgi:hypothetical protein
MKGEWPLSVWGLRGEGVEVFGHREALVSGIHHQLPFLEHVHELDAGQRCLCGVKRFEPQHGTGDPLHRSMIVFDDMIQIFHLADEDSGELVASFANGPNLL